MFLVSGAMVEFAILLHLKRNREKSLLHRIGSSEKNPMFKSHTSEYLNVKDENNISESLLNLDKSYIYPTIYISNKHFDETIKNAKRTFLHNSHIIDYTMLFLFNLLFFMFNCFYWVYYIYF